MAIFRIIYSDDLNVTYDYFKKSKARIYPVSYSGDAISKILKDLLKDKEYKKLYDEMTIINRVKRKKEREALLEKTNVVQLSEGKIHSHYNNVRYTVFLPIHKNSSRIAYLRQTMGALLDKAKEYNTIGLSFPLFGASFDTLKVKDVLELLIEERKKYPAFFNIYIDKSDLKAVKKILKKHDITYDEKEVK